MARGRPKKNTGEVVEVKSTKGNGNGATLGFEAQLFLAADKLRRIWSRPTTSMSRSV